MWPLVRPELWGPLELVTAPDGLVVSLDEAKRHCRIDEDLTDEDADLERWIRAATRYCEQDISGHRQFLTATYDFPLTGFWQGLLKMPRPPLQSVIGITYYDSSGVPQTVSSASYQVRTPFRQPGSVALLTRTLSAWPTPDAYREYPITIRFMAGYGDTGDAVPETIKQAVLLLVGLYYRDREPGKAELDTVEALLLSEGYGAYA